MTEDTPRAVEPPDLTEELRQIAAARVARMRHANRIRAAHKVARVVGVDRRNAAKLRRGESKGDE